MYILFITLGIQPCCPFSRCKCPLQNPSADLAEIWPQVFLRNQGSSSFPVNFDLGPLSGFGGDVKKRRGRFETCKVKMTVGQVCLQLDVFDRRRHDNWTQSLLKNRQVTSTWRSRSRTSQSIVPHWVSSVPAPWWTCLNLEVITMSPLLTLA